MSFDIVTVI